MGVKNYGVKTRWPAKRPSEGPGSNSLNQTPFEVMRNQPTAGDTLAGYKNHLDNPPEPKPKPPAVDYQTASNAAYEGGMQGMIQDSYVNRLKSEAEDHSQAVNIAMEGGMQSMLQDSYVNRTKSEAEDHSQAVHIALEGGMGSTDNRMQLEADQLADKLIKNNTYEPGYDAPYNDTSTAKQLAEDLYYGGHVDDLTTKEYLRVALKSRMHEDEFAQLIKEMEIISGYDSASLAPFGDGNELISIDGDIGELSDIEKLAQSIFDNSYHTVPNHGSVIYDSFSDNPFTEVLEPNDIAIEIEQLAKEDPGRALLLKLLIDQKLTPSQRADLDRILGGGAKTSENTRAAIVDPWEGLKGAGKTYINTPGELLELTWDVGNLVQPWGKADFSNDTFDFMTMELNGRAQMGGGTFFDVATLFNPGALSKSGFSIIKEGSEFIIRHGGRKVARLDADGAKALSGHKGRSDTPFRPDDHVPNHDPYSLIPRGLPELNAGPTTTKSLKELRAMEYESPQQRTARNKAAETYIRELYGSDQGELRFVLPGGGSKQNDIAINNSRKVDVPVIQENGNALLLEVKNYGSGNVRLTNAIRKQIDADALFLRDANPQNRPMWIFTEKPPTNGLIEYLDSRSIPWILYN